MKSPKFCQKARKLKQNSEILSSGLKQQNQIFLFYKINIQNKENTANITKLKNSKQKLKQEKRYFAVWIFTLDVLGNKNW